MAYFPTNVLDNQIKALPTIATASGSIATFTTDKAENLVNCEVQIVATGGGGTPTTPIAINGFDNCSVFANSVNVWEELWELGSYNNTGEKVSYGTRIRSVNKFKIKPNTTYYFHCSTSNRICFYDSNMVFVSIIFDVINTTFTTPNNAHYMAFNLVDAYGTTYNHDVSINYPSTETGYNAFSGAVIPFGTTIYGGSLDVITGKLTITHGYITYNSSTGFIEHTSGRFYKAELPTGLDFANRTESISNVATYLDQWNTYGGYFSFGSSGIYINKVSASETLTDFNTRLSNTPFQVLYPLASATVMQLDSEEVNAIVGTNNVYSDTGNITDLEYKITVGLAIS